MLENDLTNIDYRKSNLNKMTQFVPNLVRARAFELEQSGLKCVQILRCAKDYWYIIADTGTSIKTTCIQCDGEMFDAMMAERYPIETKSSFEAIGEATPIPIIPN